MRWRREFTGLSVQNARQMPDGQDGDLARGPAPGGSRRPDAGGSAERADPAERREPAEVVVVRAQVGVVLDRERG